MPDVGEVKYKVALDDSDLKSDINSTERKLEKMGRDGEKSTEKIEQGAREAGREIKDVGDTAQTSGNKLKTFGTTIAKGIGAAFVSLATVAAAGVAAVSKMGLEYNAQMQSYQTAFTTMLGDAKKAQALTDNLKNLAAKTPLAMTDLADASKILLAFGSDAAALPNQLRRLGDVAQGDAQALGTMATAFGRVQSNGYASLEEINMMIDQGFNPLQIIASKTGESMEEVRKRVSAGKVSFEELNDALVAATSAGGQFYNAMENQSKTFEGQMSTLKDNVSALAGSITEGLFNALASDTLPMVNSWIDQLSTAMEEEGVVGVSKAAGNITAQAIDYLLSGAPQFVDTGVEIIESFLEGITENSDSVAESSIELVNSLVNGIIVLTPDLLDAAGALITSLLTGLVNNAPLVMQGGGELLTKIVEGISSRLPKVIESAVVIITTLLNAILTNLPQLLEAGGEAIIKLVEGLVNGLPQIITSAGKLIDGLLQGLSSNLPKLITKGFEVVTKLVTGIAQNAPQVATAAIQLVQRIWQSFTSIDWAQLGRDVVNGVINGLWSLAGSLWNAAKDIASKAISGLMSGFDSHSPSKKAEKAAKTVPQGIVKAFDEDVLAETSSEKLAERAVKSLAHGMAYSVNPLEGVPDPSGFSANYAGNFTSQSVITIPLYLDGREIARETAWYMGEQLSWEER